MLNGGKGREGWIISTLFGALFLGSADNQLLIPLVPLLRTEMGLHGGDFGIIFSIYALSAAFGNLAIGPLSDRHGRLPFLRAGLILLALSTYLTSFSTGLPWLIAMRALAGIAGGVLSNCAASIVGDVFPYERRGRVMGMVLSSYFAALILGIPLGAWIADALGWRAVFQATAAASVAVLLVSFGVGRTLSAIQRAPGEGSPFANLGRLLRFSERRAALAVSFLVSGGTLAFLTFIGDYLSRTFGLTTVEISVVFLLSGIAAVFASPFSGWLSDRWTKRRVFLVSNSLLVVALIALPFAPWGAALFAAVFVAGLAVAFRQTSLQTLQTELVTATGRGAFMALRNGSSQLGISLAVFLAGGLYDLAGYQGVAWMAAGLTFLGSVILWLSIREPGPEPGESLKSAGAN